MGNLCGYLTDGETEDDVGGMGRLSKDACITDRTSTTPGAPEGQLRPLTHCRISPACPLEPAEGPQCRLNVLWGWVSSVWGIWLSLMDPIDVFNIISYSLV